MTVETAATAARQHEHEARTADGDREHEQEKKAKEEGVPEGEIIYRSVRQDGEYALQQSSTELAWSGLAAGMSMTFSFIAEGLLRAHLPDMPWTPLVSKFGYTAGFLIVVLGRQQLFTEQTLTAILPLLAKRCREAVGNRARGEPRRRSGGERGDRVDDGILP
jgi:hypothetical protein